MRWRWGQSKCLIGEVEPPLSDISFRIKDGPIRILRAGEGRDAIQHQPRLHVTLGRGYDLNRYSPSHSIEQVEASRGSPILIQIFLRHIIFHHFVSLYLALIGIESLFDALHRLSFQSVSFL
jgi:hypothetical protein